MQFSWGSPLGAVSAVGSSARVDGHPSVRAAADPAMTTVTPHADPTSSPTPAPPRSSAEGGTFLDMRLREVLSDIAETERGSSRKWTNVQPCVAAAVKLLLTGLESQSAAVAVLQDAVHVLASDNRLKEERHALESTEHAAAREQSWTAYHTLLQAAEEHRAERAALQQELEELRGRVRTLETQQHRQRSRQEQPSSAPPGDLVRAVRVNRPEAERTHGKGKRASKPRHPLPSSPSSDSSSSLSPSDRKNGRGHGGHRPRSRGRGRLSGGPHRSRGRPPSPSSASVSSLGSSPASDVRGSSPPTPVDSAAVASLHTTVLREVAQLREQWGAFFRPTVRRRLRDGAATAAAPPAESDGSVEESARVGCPALRGPVAGLDVGPRGAQLRPRPALFPPQRVRLYWAGNAASHFSRATRRTAAARVADGASPPLDWSDARLLDPRSGCWYSAGGWPCAMLADPWASPGEWGGGAEMASLLGRTYRDAARAWGCFCWVRPTLVCVFRSGVYRLTASLIQSLPSASVVAGGGRDEQTRAPVASRSRAPALAFYVDGARVISGGGAAAAAAGEMAGHTVLLSSAQPRRSSPRGSPQQRHGRAESASRACCAPARLAASTVSDYVYLREGAQLQVRCHNFHDTKATLEAFFELEYVV